jgi:hypothetical protein
METNLRLHVGSGTFYSDSQAINPATTTNNSGGGGGKRKRQEDEDFFEPTSSRHQHEEITAFLCRTLRHYEDPAPNLSLQVTGGESPRIPPYNQENLIFHMDKAAEMLNQMGDLIFEKWSPYVTHPRFSTVFDRVFGSQFKAKRGLEKTLREMWREKVKKEVGENLQQLGAEWLVVKTEVE